MGAGGRGIFFKRDNGAMAACQLLQMGVGVEGGSVGVENVLRGCFPWPQILAEVRKPQKLHNC